MRDGRKAEAVACPLPTPQRTLNQTGEPSTEQGCLGGHPAGLSHGAGTLILRQELSQGDPQRSEVRSRGHLHCSACQLTSGHREEPLRRCGHCLEGALSERASSQGAGELHRGHCRGGGAPTPSQDHGASNAPWGSRSGLLWGENHASALCPGAAGLAHCRERGSSPGRRDFPPALSWSPPHTEQGQETQQVFGEHCP